MSAAMQAIPKIMVFSGRQIQPSSNTEIRVGAYAEIGTVDVGVSAVCMREVCLPKEFFHSRIMLRERIDSHGARNGGETLHSDAQLIQTAKWWAPHNRRRCWPANSAHVVRDNAGARPQQPSSAQPPPVRRRYRPQCRIYAVVSVATFPVLSVELSDTTITSLVTAAGRC